MCRTWYVAKIADIGSTTSMVAVGIRVPSRGMQQTDVHMGREKMGKWIDADALIDRLDYCVKEGMGSTIAFTFKHMVEEAPSIDIEPKRGEWIEFDTKWGRSLYYCTNCMETSEVPTAFGKPLYNFCPNCGARMKGADDE